MEEKSVPIPIRYDGLDADRHQIELLVLGESLQGMARILGVSGHFISTRRYAKQIQTLDVKVYVDEPRANCFSVGAIIQFAQDQQLLAGTLPAVLAAILTWLFTRSSEKKSDTAIEDEAIYKALARLAQDDPRKIPHLMSTLERMRISLRPAMRDAVAPVGRSCTHMSIGQGGPVIDEDMAEAVRGTAVDFVTGETQLDVIISELDAERATARVRLVAYDYQRVRAYITDPAFRLAGNAYVAAFSTGVAVKVRCKLAIRADEIQTLYISNIGSP